MSALSHPYGYTAAQAIELFGANILDEYMRKLGINGAIGSPEEWMDVGHFVAWASGYITEEVKKSDSSSTSGAMSKHKRSLDLLVDSQVDDGIEDGPSKRPRPTEDEDDASDTTIVSLRSDASKHDNNISTLCHDVLGHILGYLVDEVAHCSEPPNQHAALMQLLTFASVCTSWRKIALNSAVEWAKFAGCYTVSPKLMELILERSGKAPLVVDADVQRGIRFHEVLSEDFEAKGSDSNIIANMRSVIAHSERFRELKLYFHDRLSIQEADGLNKLFSRRMDSLEFLDIEGVADGPRDVILSTTNLFGGSTTTSLKRLELYGVTFSPCSWGMTFFKTVDYLGLGHWLFDHDPSVKLAWMEPLRALTSLNWLITGYFCIPTDNRRVDYYIDRIDQIQPVSLSGLKTLQLEGNLPGVSFALALMNIPQRCSVTITAGIWDVDLEGIGERTFAQLDKMWPEDGCDWVGVAISEDTLEIIVEFNDYRYVLEIMGDLGPEEGENIEQEVAEEFSRILSGLSKGPRFQKLGARAIWIDITCRVDGFIKGADHESLREFFRCFKEAESLNLSPGALDFLTSRRAGMWPIFVDLKNITVYTGSGTREFDEIEEMLLMFQHMWYLSLALKYETVPLLESVCIREGELFVTL
ncbi:hypothetical protein CC1G_05576 [Coprinopsis cinerea okayama7|uniref:F-box domain-containing protein n=1 Tax=Coprinopsis cinerea (strain Okayama-7 / 130 / ATCC MYA-4618 / FGSC 9003) TaxID=240176 RepID=A8P1H3_COPC7|nr:hypothetical protein CC1G_05576 [Coprinopsis cinerea okayama7\|eukprot:XP_001838095.1 hypothetical protein CC1G_05576 [Coprinopsis cinerea okayama7\